jgi:hypothetical protein
MTDRISLPASAGGAFAHTLGGCHPRRTERGNCWGGADDARTEELGNLRLALATFAFQLDAFELRMRGTPASAPCSRHFDGGDATERAIGSQ